MKISSFALSAVGALLLAPLSGAQTPQPDTVQAVPVAAISPPFENAPAPAKPTAADSSAQVPPAKIIQPKEDKRAYGVLPNYRTAEADVPFAPITNHQKLMIGVKDSFDGTAYPLAAFFSGIGQLTNANPSYGQGVEGYAKRYGAAFADQVMGNTLTEALLPIWLHEDPRFFRKGSGRFWSRVGYAATRVFVCKTDSGGSTFNVAEILGNGTVASLGNIYYVDNRGLSATMTRMFTQIGTDSLSNVLKEFWPDVKRRYGRGHREKMEGQQKTPVAGTE